MAWVREVRPEDLEDLILLKHNKMLEPYAKFLIILCKHHDAKSLVNILKEVVGLQLRCTY